MRLLIRSLLVSSVLIQSAAAISTGGPNLPAMVQPDLDIYCACEHYGSPLDGICEVFVDGRPPNTPTFNGVLTYEWSAFGAAYIPSPPPPRRPFAIYQINHAGIGGGLDVQVSYSATVVLSSSLTHTYKFIYSPTRCLIGTVGGG